MDEDIIKKAGTAPLLEILQGISDMFCAQSEEKDGDIRDTIVYLNKLGVSALVYVNLSSQQCTFQESHASKTSPASTRSNVSLKLDFLENIL